ALARALRPTRLYRSRHTHLETRGRQPMGLRDKYNQAIQTAKSLRFDGSAQEENGKLHFRGTVNSQDEANKIWDAIKTVPDWQNDIQADIKVNPAAAQQT